MRVKRERGLEVYPALDLLLPRNHLSGEGVLLSSRLHVDCGLM